MCMCTYMSICIDYLLGRLRTMIYEMLTFMTKTKLNLFTYFFISINRETSMLCILMLMYVSIDCYFFSFYLVQLYPYKLLVWNQGCSIQTK